MLRGVLQFVIQLFVGDVDIFGGGDAIDDQFGLDVVRGARCWPLRRPTQSTIDGAGIDALSRKRTNYAFETHIHLTLHQNFGDGEVVRLDQRGQNFFAEHVLMLVIALVLQAFADFCLQLVERRRVADVLRELVVEFRVVSSF